MEKGELVELSMVVGSLAWRKRAGGALDSRFSNTEKMSWWSSRWSVLRRGEDELVELSVVGCLGGFSSSLVEGRVPDSLPDHWAGAYLCGRACGAAVAQYLVLDQDF
jgi:hypothetical protein